MNSGNWSSIPQTTTVQKSSTPTEGYKQSRNSYLGLKRPLGRRELGYSVLSRHILYPEACFQLLQRRGHLRL